MNLCPEEGPAEVEAHDGHPGEHAHAHVVANVTSKTKKVIFFSGPATNRGGMGKGLATKKKERFLKL